MQTPRTNLLNLNLAELKVFFTELGEKPFRATQIFKWIHARGVSDFDQMTDVSKALRLRLTESAEVKAPEIIYESDSNDGTVKWVLELEDGQKVETVFIPERDRGTLCVSSQVGCALDCQFCSTAKQGFNRNLSVAEIIGQVWKAEYRLREKRNLPEKQMITNVVMMGMGEPLLNFDAVVTSMNIMMHDLAYGLSKRRVTLSTSGVVPALRKLIDHTDVALAISLHAPTDELRSEIVPINRKYPIRELLDATKAYVAKSKGARGATIEYVMLKGINDQISHAKALAKLLANLPCKINLIPFNPYPYAKYERSTNAAIDAFGAYLMKKGFNVITRRTRGDDIDAACGQLVGEVTDKTKRLERGKPVTKREIQPKDLIHLEPAA